MGLVDVMRACALISQAVARPWATMSGLISTLWRRWARSNRARLRATLAIARAVPGHSPGTVAGSEDASDWGLSDSAGDVSVRGVGAEDELATESVGERSAQADHDDSTERSVDDGDEYLDARRYLLLDRGPPELAGDMLDGSLESAVV